MKSVLKFLLLLSIAVLIAGCKLAIIVVEGGEVQSDGSGVCLAGSICIVDVSDPDFAETFSAVPNDGWAFQKWNSGSGFFCGGSSEPFCHLSFAGHEESKEVAKMVASDDTFYLMPVFKRISGYPPIVGGNKEWLQPADFLGYSPRQVEAICPPPSGACSGSLPNSSVDLTGYYWASLDDIAQLLNGMRPYDSPINGSDLVDPLPDPPDPELLLGVDEDFLFEYFTHTYKFFEGGPQLVLSAFSRDRAEEPRHYEGIVIQYGWIQDGDTFIDDRDADGSGAWFWRPLE